MNDATANIAARTSAHAPHAAPVAPPPLVSFCIPTYNRARYLDSLLHMLVAQLQGFPYPFEVFVADNASTDETPRVLAEHAALGALPLRSERHAANCGGPLNWQYVRANARGTYLIYLADDDAILGERVAATVALMEADASIGIAYAPWLLFDLVAEQPQGQFYRQAEDIQVAQGEQAQLLDALLRHSVFPEIYICRREVLAQVMPRVNEQAFFAFVHAADFLQRSSVLLLKDPFYVSITRYFADEQRTQAGATEAEYAWDRYRGGLEYILGRAADGLTREQLAAFSRRIEHVIAQRMSVAVRLRVQQQRDAVETYYLAYRLKAMGEAALLPLPMNVLRGQAAMSFLATDAELLNGVSRLVCVGEFEPDLRAYVEQRATLPVSFVGAEADLSALGDALVFTRHNVDAPAAPGLRLVREQELMRRFPQ